MRQSKSRDGGGKNKVIDKLGEQIVAWQQMQAHLANDLVLRGSYCEGNCCLCLYCFAEFTAKQLAIGLAPVLFIRPATSKVGQRTEVE